MQDIECLKLGKAVFVTIFSGVIEVIVVIVLSKQDSASAVSVQDLDIRRSFQGDQDITTFRQSQVGAREFVAFIA